MHEGCQDGAAAVASVIALAAPAQAQTIPATGVGSATVVPLQVTGPAANRFNLVIAGDGYTEAEQDKFMQQVDKHLNIMWTIEPYKCYRNYINVYAIKIISAESGIGCDPNLTSPRKDTPLSMAFWGGCSAAACSASSRSTTRALSRYTALAPGVSQRLAIGNTDTYGGAGGTYATATGGNALSALISPHEIGHSLGGLQDEYDYYPRGVLGGCYTGGEPTSIHHTLLTDRPDAHPAEEVVALDRRAERGRRPDRPLRGRHVLRQVRLAPEPALDHEDARLLLRPGQPRGHDAADLRAREARRRLDAHDGPVGNTDTLWLDTQHPVDHELNVTWSLDGTAVPDRGQPPHAQARRAGADARHDAHGHRQGASTRRRSSATPRSRTAPR